MINVNNGNVIDVKKGSTDVVKIYHGSDLVWQKKSWEVTSAYIYIDTDFDGYSILCPLDCVFRSNNLELTFRFNGSGLSNIDSNDIHIRYEICSNAIIPNGLDSNRIIYFYGYFNPDNITIRDDEINGSSIIPDILYPYGDQGGRYVIFFPYIGDSYDDYDNSGNATNFDYEFMYPTPSNICFIRYGTNEKHYTIQAGKERYDYVAFGMNYNNKWYAAGNPETFSRQRLFYDYNSVVPSRAYSGLTTVSSEQEAIQCFDGRQCYITFKNNCATYGYTSAGWPNNSDFHWYIPSAGEAMVIDYFWDQYPTGWPAQHGLDTSPLMSMACFFNIPVESFLDGLVMTIPTTDYPGASSTSILQYSYHAIGRNFIPVYAGSNYIFCPFYNLT